MKKIILMTSFMLGAIFTFAQQNEIRINFSTDLFEDTYAPDHFRSAENFGISMEYARLIYPKLQLESGLGYSNMELQYYCHDCIFPPAYNNTHEISAKAGLRYQIASINRFSLSVGAGIQIEKLLGVEKLQPMYEYTNLSTTLYEDMAIRFQLNETIGIDWKIKCDFNVTNDSNFSRNRIQPGTALGINFSF